MKNYIVKSFHDVSVDDYAEGEGKRINSYALSDEVQAETPKQAVEKYLQDSLGYNLDFANCDIDEGGEFVQTSCLVDSGNTQPDNAQLKRWVLGELELYVNHISMSVSEVVAVNFKQTI